MRAEQRILKHEVQTVANSHDFIVRVMMCIVFLKAPVQGAEYLSFHFFLLWEKKKKQKKK